jgi:glycosyltransferase involved in cell wall biosynthesis
MTEGRSLSIVHVDPERGLGGGERQVLGLVAALRDAGHRQTVAVDPNGRLADLVAACGVATAPLPVRHHLDVPAARALARLLAQERCDIVHFHTARAHAMSAFLGRSPGVARVVTRRMDYRLRGGWYTRRLYNHEVQAVVAISEGVRAALVASGVDATRITVVPSGVAVDRFASAPAARAAARARFGLGADAWVLAVVGALETRKGHDVLLDALARLPIADAAVLVAGEGSMRDALRARADALALGARVRWLGRLDDVTDVLAAADALVMPSRHEGLGVAVLEAMAAALPVVASRIGGLPEAVVDEVTGLLVPPGDAEALAAALTRLAEDRASAARLGVAGAQRVRARFSMEAMAHGTLAVYRRVLAREVGHG